MFLYWSVRRRWHRRCRRRRPQILVHALTFEQFVDFFHIGHDCWPWPIDCLSRFWSIFVVTLTLNFQSQIWNWLYHCQKWSDCHETKSKHIDWSLGLKQDHQMWPWPCPRPWNLLHINQKLFDCHKTKSKHIGLNSRPQMWPMGLGWIFEFSRPYVILTIWWPRSGVRIYPIMTGVTSNVGAPSTHLAVYVPLLW